VDEPGNQAIAGKYKVKSMPTFVAIKKPETGEDKGKGEVVQTFSGADMHGLKEMVRRHASRAYTPASTGLSQEAEKEKDTGNNFFKEAKYSSAIEAYTRAIDLSSLTSTGVAVLYANRALSYLKLLPSQPSVTERNKLRPQILQDAIKANELEPLWGKGYVRMADAFLESASEESLSVVPEEKRDEGRRKGLDAAAEALEEAVELSEGRARSEALAQLESVRKKLSQLSSE